MIYIVSGFMRSGTSMMMSCLEAGGLQVLKSKDRDNFNAIHSDEHYKPNPNGLYEPDLKEIGEIGWPKQYDGYAIKVVAPWLKSLSVHNYKVIFMLRDFEEIRQSFEGAFNGKLKCERIEKIVLESLAQLRNRKDVELITLQYRKVIEYPLESLTKIKNFGVPINIENATKVIDKNLCRFKLENLTIGI